MDGVPNHHVDFRVFKTHSQKISTYTRRSLRRSYHRWPSYRIPQIFLGDPKIFLGDLKLFIGDHRLFIGDPRLINRDPKLFIGDPKLLIGEPNTSSKTTSFLIRDP